MLLRRLARPLLASSFVYDGVQAAKNPAEHAAAAREGAALVTERLGTSPLTESQVMTLVRAHGVATVLCGIALAVGKAPRTAALALAALTVPLAVVNQPFTAKGAEREARTAKFVKNLGMLGATVIAGVDLEGRPGLSYRVSHASAAAARSAQLSARSAQRSVHDVSHRASHTVSAAARKAEKAAQRAAKQGRRAAKESRRALAGVGR
ncbi:DoxX family membrane protein [Isoptericola variabilis]|uniref:DoxX family protein n=1 Tax=Isoptericola variabilis (strain 225) TaxID=743718 RepID=F6FRJ8_ISOV2|nr:DoxX family membrane protein [Isoptericola variabilis]AEG45056.1 DoxX family protein [Isoptericola variabilis 225]TWH26183.1 DoxX-like protein [Isoptericola variabilis J7]